MPARRPRPLTFIPSSRGARTNSERRTQTARREAARRVEILLQIVAWHALSPSSPRAARAGRDPAGFGA
jgi:hypothetical protein